MELDYIDNFNAYGDNIIRLYNFDRKESVKFYEILFQQIIVNKTELKLSSIDFIQARNCSLTMQISDIDEGITSTDDKSFICRLTKGGYEKMLQLLLPFCEKETKGFQYLYDIDSLTDFLFTPSGSW
ncbi:MAG: hypothetical protein ACOYO1_04435 [Bacteroidales bacterium]